MKFPEPGQDFTSSNEKALVFGQLEILTEGYPLPLNPSTIWIYPLSPYLKKEVSISQTILVDIDPESGYFAAALPPGAYAAGDIGFRPGWGTGFRDMNRKVCAGCRLEGPVDLLKKPSPILPVFEVLPGQATYIGTMQAITDLYLNIDRWEIKSKYEDMKKTFFTLYPNHATPVEKLMELNPCIQEKTYKIGVPLCLPIKNN
ncbi:MAG: hypothetical protein C4526_10705 [Nitrospiraceae bacterium]|nr:MAG: hypothetical protein C4526_10705 [Nitrospiraceae bacterium]